MAHGRRPRSLQVWCLAYLCMLGAQAVQVQVNFQMSNNIASWLVSDYGLEVGGSITMELTNSQPANDTYVLILTRGQLLEWRDADDNLVILTPLNDKAARPLNSFLVSAWRSNLREHLQGTFRAEEATGGRNRYNVVIMSATKSPLDIRGKLTLENPNGQQLSIQDVYVPKTLLVAANIYLMTAVFTALGLITRPRSGRNALHCLALTVIFLRGVSLLLRWLDYRIIATTGVESSAVDITWKLLSKVQNILELMSFLLISLGWKVLRSSLDVSEIRFAVAVSIISFYLGVFQVACTTQATCSGYQLSRYILHSLCFLVVIVAMNFNLQKLASAISEAPATVESGKLYRKLSAYYIFRWVFLGFIIAPTVELFLKVTVVPWDAQWLYIAIQELRTWVIYALLIYAFRMTPASPRVFELTREVVTPREGEGGNDANSEAGSEEDMPAPPWA
mmetsp:Transcript_45946/g.107415  ORF Transcript_45946/g.107415 Transcript_45946/m.107415 type:complete len:449 (-) Transcript_45946:8-1354(-)|eukprot:s3285_g2.t1